MSDGPPETRSASGKAARNERIKLFATSLNTIGLATFALGVLTPAFAGTLSLSAAFKILAGTAIFVALHTIAQVLLRWLKD